MTLNRNESKSWLSKVPEVTIFFWIIKVLCTTVGETFSDFLSVNAGLGLTLTTVLMGVAFLVVLFLQFKATRYVPILYWLTVVLISVFGTLVTDNLTDALGVPLETSTIVFSGLLALTLLLWYLSEKTLSIHSIFTVRREAFYWLTILFTFALGTAVGDLFSEQLGLGYLKTGIAVVVVIAIVFAAWKARLNEILAFWIVYILTRPLGASLGDYLSQSKVNGGLALGATLTSVIFSIAIVAVIVFLGVSKVDVISNKETDTPKTGNQSSKSVFLQTAVALVVFLAAGIGGYEWCAQHIVPKVDASQTSLSGQLANFIATENEMLQAVNTGDFATGKSDANQLEHDWDKAEPKLRKIDRKTWTRIDGTIDDVLAATRAKQPNEGKCQSALQDSLDSLNQANA
ncbi:COG4705 family protein [Cohnella hashimotonis]|uniref:Membrane-anchored protein n=1 Tax=Cohnella hashimotonis TaxID=2826895 RepID=A0ABT6TKG4_9BACL|nr:hypothetical protein [Cohnella hashimotonis]MDI4646332.1 hypothetical protein [Cohnella hashimotonis]